MSPSDDECVRCVGQHETCGARPTVLALQAKAAQFAAEDESASMRNRMTEWMHDSLTVDFGKAIRDQTGQLIDPGVVYFSRVNNQNEHELPGKDFYQIKVKRAEDISMRRVWVQRRMLAQVRIGWVCHSHVPAAFSAFLLRLCAPTARFNTPCPTA